MSLNVYYFTEMPYHHIDDELAEQWPSLRLTFPNSYFDPNKATDLFKRYLDEFQYAEEAGFQGLMINEHHNTPSCMDVEVNITGGILARMTSKAKILMLGNMLPTSDNPPRLAEEIAMLDVLSGGRIVSGFVRGIGVESWANNTNPVHNRERFEECHDLIIKTWTTPGPFRWEGKHYQYRHVNPWARPYQKPHPQVWLPGVISRDSLMWAAEKRIPYIMLSTELEPTKKAFQLYHDRAAELGYESGPQNLGYLWKVHVDETEELAEETGRKFVQGPSNPFLAGNEGTVNPALLTLPGLTSRKRVLPTQAFSTANRGGAAGVLGRPYEQQIKDYTIISGTPKTVIPKIRHVLEYLRPGSIFFWDGDGAMTHDDAMRSLRLMGEEVIPAVKEIAQELELPSSFEINPATGKSYEDQTANVDVDRGED